ARRPPRASFTALLAAAAAVAGALVAMGLVFDAGPLSARMALHLVVMNVVAPLVAALLSLLLAKGVTGWNRLWAFATLQMALLWAWHVPRLADADNLASQTVLLLVLLCVATGFWMAVAGAGQARRWGAVGALLVTGKLACLLGGLLLFAPRDLYGLPAMVFALCAVGPSSLEDQQLAGMMMLVACPLSYVMAAVVLTVDAVGATAPDAPRSRLPERR
ncbi:MAG: cytochrome c oxidase assembly protein, partial [Pseudomonadota bacterium]